MHKTLVIVTLLSSAVAASAPCSAWRREQRVEAQRDGQWMKSTVVRCDQRKGYLVHFDGYPSSQDLWLEETAIRLPPGVADAQARQKELEAAAAAAGYKSNEYVYVQRATDKERFVAKLWNAGPTMWSVMSGGVETRLELGDIKGRWSPSDMKRKVGDKCRYLANGFFPAVITAIEAGGYRATITGATDPNVLGESAFVDDWTYEAFDEALKPVKALRELNLAALAEVDTTPNAAPTLPREAKEDSVAEFEKVVRAYETVDATLKEKFATLPPLERPNCSICPSVLASVVARHKELLKRVVPLDPSKVVEEFERLTRAQEASYNHDFRPNDADDIFAAKNGVKMAQDRIARRLKKYTAYGELLGVKVDPNLPKINANIASEAAKFRGFLKKSPPVLDSFKAEGTTFAVSDKSLEGAAKSYLSGLYPKAKCKLLGTEKHDWRPDGTGDSFVGRYKYVAFDCTDPDYDFPSAVVIAVEQPHLGFGKFGPAEGAWVIYSYYRK